MSTPGHTATLGGPPELVAAPTPGGPVTAAEQSGTQP